MRKRPKPLSHPWKSWKLLQKLWVKTFKRNPLEVKSAMLIPGVNGTMDDIEKACAAAVDDPIIKNLIIIDTEMYNAPRDEKHKDQKPPPWYKWDDDLKIGYPVDKFGNENVSGSFVRYLQISRADGTTYEFDFFHPLMHPIPQCLKKLLIDESIKRIGFAWDNDCNALNNTEKSLRLSKRSSINADAQMIFEDITDCEKDFRCNSKSQCICGADEIPFDFAGVTKGLASLCQYFFNIDIDKDWTPQCQDWNKSTKSVLGINPQKMLKNMGRDAVCHFDVYMVFDMWYSQLSKFRGVCRNARDLMDREEYKKILKRARPFLFRLPENSVWEEINGVNLDEARSAMISAPDIARPAQQINLPSTSRLTMGEGESVMDVIEHAAKRFRRKFGRKWCRDATLYEKIEQNDLYIRMKYEIVGDCNLLPEEKKHYKEVLFRRFVNAVCHRHRSSRRHRRKHKKKARRIKRYGQFARHVPFQRRHQ